VVSNNTDRQTDTQTCLDRALTMLVCVLLFSSVLVRNEAFDSYAVCNSTMSGEDPTCSDSLSLPISVADHLTYRGIDISSYCSDAKSGSAAAQPRAEQIMPAIIPEVSPQEDAATRPQPPPKQPRAKIVLTEF
jgi:hypothetical protein